MATGCQKAFFFLQFCRRLRCWMVKRVMSLIHCWVTAVKTPEGQDEPHRRLGPAQTQKQWVGEGRLEEMRETCTKKTKTGRPHRRPSHPKNRHPAGAKENTWKTCISFRKAQSSLYIQQLQKVKFTVLLSYRGIIAQMILILVVFCFLLPGWHQDEQSSVIRRAKSGFTRSEWTHWRKVSLFSSTTLFPVQLPVTFTAAGMKARNRTGISQDKGRQTSAEGSESNTRDTDIQNGIKPKK